MPIPDPDSALVSLHAAVCICPAWDCTPRRQEAEAGPRRRGRDTSGLKLPYNKQPSSMVCPTEPGFRELRTGCEPETDRNLNVFSPGRDFASTDIKVARDEASFRRHMSPSRSLVNDAARSALALRTPPTPCSRTVSSDPGTPPRWSWWGRYGASPRSRPPHRHAVIPCRTRPRGAAG